MNSSFENSNNSSFVYSDSSTVDGKFMSLNAPSNGDNGNNDSYANRSGFQTAEALVEDGIKHACQQLTMKLSDIQMSSRRAAEAATRRTDVAAWLNGMFSTVNLPDEPSEEDLRACLSNGSILCQVMNKLNPGSIPKIVSKPGLATTEGAAHSAYQRFENVRNFLVAIDDLRLPTFEASDLEQGNMVTVVDCLLSLKEFYDSKNGVETQSLWKQGADTGIPNDIKSTVRGTSPGKSLNTTLKCGSQPRKRWVLPDLENCAASDNQVTDQSSGVNGPKVVKLPLRFDAESLLSSSVMSDSTSAWIQNIGQKFREDKSFERFCKRKALSRPSSSRELTFLYRSRMVMQGIGHGFRMCNQSKGEFDLSHCSTSLWAFHGTSSYVLTTPNFLPVFSSNS